MAKLGPAVAFATTLYRMRAGLATAGYLKRDPMALLSLRPGRQNPYAIYDRMRAIGPVLPTRLGNWSTTSHRVCNAVLRDRRFGVRPTEADGVEPAGDQFDLSFLSMNPPDHTRLRRLAQPAFSPKAVAGYRERIERRVGELLDRAAAQGEFDLVSAFAAPVPIAVITDLLGVPDAALRHAARLRAGDAELRRLFGDLFALRRREPADDVVSQLVAAEGHQIKPGEMVPLCTLLLVAGFETTVNLIGNGVAALLDPPDQWEALRADPAGLAPKVVEEVLRYDPPVQRTSRIALQPMELEGKPVHKGQLVVTLIGGANRDPEAYERPAVFDPHREGGPDHLAFSSGIHYCVGQPLASIEATIAFQLLAERMPRLRRVGPIRRRNANTIRGPIHFPVAA